MIIHWKIFLAIFTAAFVGSQSCGVFVDATSAAAPAVPIDKDYVEQSRLMWEKSIARPLKIQATVEAKDAKSNAVVSKSTDRLIQKEGHRLIAMDYSINEKPKNACGAMCSNRQYMAIVMKDAGKSDWVIRRVLLPEQDAESYKQLQYQPESKNFFSHMTVFYVPIHKIMASEKSIKRVVPHVTSSGTSYEIDFDFAKTDVPEHQIARIYGTIITDSRFSGVIKSAKYIVEAKYGKGNTDYACEVRPDRDGYPVLISTTVSGAFTETSGIVHPNIISRTEFEDLKASTIKDEEFRLTAFGLPEPVGIVWDDEKTPIIQSTPLYVWLLGGAGGFAVLAITFAYFRRRVLRKRALTVRTGVRP